MKPCKFGGTQFWIIPRSVLDEILPNQSSVSWTFFITFLLSHLFFINPRYRWAEMPQPSIRYPKISQDIQSMYRSILQIIPGQREPWFPVPSIYRWPSSGQGPPHPGRIEGPMVSVGTIDQFLGFFVCSKIETTSQWCLNHSYIPSGYLT